MSRSSNLIDFPRLETVAYIPGEAFTVDVSFIADDGEQEYLVADGYIVKLNWPGDGNEQVFVAELSVIPLTGDDRGVRVTLVVPASVTEFWPFDIKYGTLRILRGVGSLAQTIAGGEIRPSRLARNVG